MRRSSGLLALLLVAAAACSGSDDAAEPDAPSTTTTTVATTTTRAGTTGCGQPAPEIDGDRLAHATIESSGGTRAYMVFVPGRYDPEVPAAVVYNFHGAASNKEEQLIYSGFRPMAEEEGALIVLPDALGDPMRWSPYGPAVAGVEGVDDLVFFDDLSTAVDATLCIDPERVLVTGISSGGFMAASVACARSEQVAAVGPVAATVPASVLCGEAEPIAYAYFHGTEDESVPFEGGAGTPGPVEATSQEWADHNGCSGEPTDERIGTEVVHRSWSGCEASTDLYIVEGGGHSWPGAIAVGFLGHTTDDVDATTEIWDVFRATWP